MKADEDEEETEETDIAHVGGGGFVESSKWDRKAPGSDRPLMKLSFC